MSIKMNFQTHNLTAESGAAYLLEKLKPYQISPVHEAWIQNVLAAVEENAIRKAKKI